MDSMSVRLRWIYRVIFPDDVDVNSVESKLSNRGILTIRAAKREPIHHECTSINYFSMNSIIKLIKEKFQELSLKTMTIFLFYINVRIMIWKKIWSICYFCKQKKILLIFPFLNLLVFPVFQALKRLTSRWSWMSTNLSLKKLK